MQQGFYAKLALNWKTVLLRNGTFLDIKQLQSELRIIPDLTYR